MVLKRNTQAGKNNFKLLSLVFYIYFCLIFDSKSQSNLEGIFTDIKVLDKTFQILNSFDDANKSISLKDLTIITKLNNNCELSIYLIRISDKTKIKKINKKTLIVLKVKALKIKHESNILLK